MALFLIVGVTKAQAGYRVTVLMKHGTRIPRAALMVTLSATEMIFPGGGAWVAIAFIFIYLFIYLFK